MKRSAWIMIILGLLSFSGAACENKQGTPPPKPEVASQPASPFASPPNMPLHPPTEAMTPKVPKTVAVPDAVKGHWESVLLRIEDKSTKVTTDHTVALFSEFPIPESDLTIKAGNFLPDFSMGQTEITSSSNETKNPALKYSILQNGEEVFSGWLFERFPDMHPFQHERFAITLVGYNPKSTGE